jgi:hypothetical protein
MILFFATAFRIGAGVAQSVWRLGYGLGDRGSVLGRGNDGIYSLSYRFKTGSGTHPVSSPLDTGGSFPGDKGGRNVKLTTLFHLVPRLEMRRYISPLPQYDLTA